MKLGLASLLLAQLSHATLMSWDEAHNLAKPIVAQMTPKEKSGMMLGIGWEGGQLKKWWYVGNTAAVPRLGMPTLNMQDAAGGFRTYWTEMVGSVTCWPSLLSMAATFDVDMVHKFAISLGKEFAAKGANVILGPSINVHRVARNGRNFEYLSGEDPYLGARLTEQYVTGVQSQGVMSVMKHWVFNSQETNRESSSSVVDRKTAYELYYPPFEAGVRAGVSGVMCSYNRINGTYACENDVTLTTDLKKAMGFQGFVQSDWGATHSTSVSQGLDQEMPMTPDGSFGYYFDETHLEGLAVDDSVERIVAAAIRLGLLYNESSRRLVPHTADHGLPSSPGAAHATKTRAAKALPQCTDYCSETGCDWTARNACPWADQPGTAGWAGDDGSVGYSCCCVQRTDDSQPCGGPPSGPPSNCTALGGDSYATDVHVGCCEGLIEQKMTIEGRPTAQFICVAPPGACEPLAEDCLMTLVATTEHAALARAAAAASIVLLKNADGVLPLKPGTVNTIAIVGSAANGSAFDPTSDQGHGTWNTGDYYSGGGSGHVTAGDDVLITTLAGLAERAATAGIAVVSAPTDDISAALAAVAQADVALVVGATSSGEALDRADLNLDHDADALIAAVGASGTPTVALLQVPGAVLTPWRDNVSAAAVMFLGGQETGHAWADVLFGDVNPTGKLPIMLPRSEADTIAPSPDDSIPYAEGLRTSYRQTEVTPAYPFGHGLSYTTFDFNFDAPPHLCSDGKLCANVTIANTGAVAGATVVQLYVEFPPEAAQPAPLLKGFAKTPTIASGAWDKLTFELTERDLSYYDVAVASWVKADMVHLLVGASSADVHDAVKGVATGVVEA
mmetsp:Transcript_35795/g.94007  ORF Transcript_35795/g.94007 Transcript_35795/m.94007 type:complete len:845 (+) Transcript_35795:43-2577(+)